MRSLAVVCSVLALARAAGADADVAPTETPRVTAEEHPFLHVSDPTTPSAGTAAAGYAVGLGSGVAADRPLPSSIATAGPSHTFSFAFGVTSAVAPYAAATFGPAGAFANVGLRVQLTDPRSEGPFRLSIAGAFFREPGATVGFLARAAGSYDVGALRVAANVHLERAFARDRDAIDVVALAGLSYRLVHGLRLGAEYIGQDLEELGEGGAEGGAKHYVGPTAAFDLARGRAQLVLGPSFGIGQRAARFLGRMAVTVAF